VKEKFAWECLRVKLMGIIASCHFAFIFSNILFLNGGNRETAVLAGVSISVILTILRFEYIQCNTQLLFCGLFLFAILFFGCVRVT